MALCGLFSDSTGGPGTAQQGRQPGHKVFQRRSPPLFFAQWAAKAMEWGVNADLNPEPGTFLVEWESQDRSGSRRTGARLPNPPASMRPAFFLCCSCARGLTDHRPDVHLADWKGDTKKKKVNVFINMDGVTVTRVQTKKKEPKVGTWDWYHIKSWDVAPNHFAFKIVGADGGVTNYMFDTKQVRCPPPPPLPRRGSRLLTDTLCVALMSGESHCGQVQGSGQRHHGSQAETEGSGTERRVL
jgi:hypothetical protein